MNEKTNFQDLVIQAVTCEILNVQAPFSSKFSAQQREVIEECRSPHLKMSLISESSANSGKDLLEQRKILQRKFRKNFGFSLPL